MIIYNYDLNLELPIGSVIYSILCNEIVLTLPHGHSTLLVNHFDFNIFYIP